MRRFSVATLAGVFSVVVVHGACAAGAAPTSSWTGFYIGGVIGGGWADRTVTYAGNDPASAIVINGTFGLFGQQPVASHGFTGSGVTGGFEIGYNWQFAPRWLAGLEADINGSGISGSSTGTSVLQGPPAINTYTQTVTSKQTLDWFGTVRGRLGWLPTDDLLLYATGGLAYGRVGQSDSYMFNGPGPVGYIVASGNYSVRCLSNATCLAGSNSRTSVGWTVGGGAEWRFLPHWSVKAEYLYINLGHKSVTAIANAVAVPGNIPASYNAAFGTADFHIARVGLNFHW
jgi:outer membrane immunogenic protein